MRSVSIRIVPYTFPERHSNCARDIMTASFTPLTWFQLLCRCSLNKYVVRYARRHCRGNAFGKGMQTLGVQYTALSTLGGYGHQFIESVKHIVCQKISSPIPLRPWSLVALIIHAKYLVGKIFINHIVLIHRRESAKRVISGNTSRAASQPIYQSYLWRSHEPKGFKVSLVWAGDRP